MEYRSIGRTDVDASVIGFGLWTLNTPGWGLQNSDAGGLLLRESYDNGVTLYDTSDSYGQGASEILLSEALGDHRHNIIISTKMGFDFYAPKLRPSSTMPKNFRPEYITYACEKSLTRLNTDYVDLYGLHYPDLTDIETDEVFEALETLLDEGKILSYSVAIDDNPEIRETVDILIGDRRAPALHFPFNILEHDLFDYISSNLNEEIPSLMVRRPHCYGFLDSSLGITTLPKEIVSEEGLPEHVYELSKRAEALSLIDELNEMKIEEVALRFILDNPIVTSVIPNFQDLNQIQNYCLVAEMPPLDHDLHDKLAKL